MSARWPEWARQDEAPIAVAFWGERLHRHDGADFTVAVYADGTVLTAHRSRDIPTLTPEQVRQMLAALEFPGDDYEAFIWHLARQAANARQIAAETKEG